MDFSLASEEQELQRWLRQIVKEGIAPMAEEADESLPIHVSASLVKGARIGRLYREAQALDIHEGTSEIQRHTIARQLLRERR